MYSAPAPGGGQELVRRSMDVVVDVDVDVTGTNGETDGTFL